MQADVCGDLPGDGVAIVAVGRVAGVNAAVAQVACVGVGLPVEVQRAARFVVAAVPAVFFHGADARPRDVRRAVVDAVAREDEVGQRRALRLAQPVVADGEKGGAEGEEYQHGGDEDGRRDAELLQELIQSQRAPGDDGDNRGAKWHEEGGVVFQAGVGGRS